MRSMQGTLCSTGRAGKGLELPCSSVWSQASEEGWDLLLPAQHCWHLEDVLGGMESTGIFQEGSRGISPSCAQPGPSAPGATSMRAPCFWASTVNLGLLPSFLLFLILFAPQNQSRGSKSCFCKAL